MAVAAEARTVTLPALAPLEVASAMLFAPAPRRQPVASTAQTPWEALREVLLPALQRGPCAVAFSGGRDSSAILAASVHIAREAGLPDPIPLTMRFPDHPRTHEQDWQEAVVAHLGLREHVLVSPSSELDMLGPLATDLLRRHGLYWPSNAHGIALLAREVAGGALVTGNGGDELFMPWTGRWLDDVKHGRVRPRVGELEHVVLGVVPERARRLAWRVRNPVRLHWLTAHGGRELARAIARQWSEQPESWGAQVEGVCRGRYRQLSSAAAQACVREHDTLLVEPFFEPAFARACVRAFPRHGPASRAEALQAVFGDLLPSATLQRSTKATFTEVFWGPASRAFAAGCDGAGIDRDLVDVEALRGEWAKPAPDARSTTALQAAWLACQP